ncbi:MAG TPA: replication initiator [Nocardioidaceae bacterium]|nr:replication initiator [Nocardioidaceae bacterium]
MSTRTKAAVTDTLPALFPAVFPGHGVDAPLDLPPVTQQVQQQITDRLASPGFDAWSETLARVGNCSKPIRLHGHSQTVDATTGEILSSYSSRHEPLGVTHVRCGNRRAVECPSCSRLYAADTFHLIRAGVAGGKTVPETVAENPLVFATVTAPSFGRVHGRRDGARRCHPTVRGSRRCPHGWPRTCQASHDGGDQLLGHPLCGECYDNASHVVWQWWAPDLWRRFSIALRRLVAKTLDVPASRLADVATVQYAKVAEYQLRGVVHFHALVRLDGPKTPQGFAPAPPAVDATVLADLVRQAAASVRLTVPGVDDHDPNRVLAFGRQLDARPVRTGRRTDDPDRTLTPEQVAGYLAKYATKSATDTGNTDSPHHRRIRATARELATRARTHAHERGDDEGPYERLGKWVHMLGFRGHFATKSRRYSVTLGALRRARRRAQALIAEHKADGRPLDLAALEADLLADDEDETTLVIGHWSYAGTGWATEGERVLAVAAAARAREYDRWKAEQRMQRKHTQKKGQSDESD